MVYLVVTQGRRFNESDAPSLGRRNIERRPDGWLASRVHNLAWLRPDQNHLAPESCKDLYSTRGYMTSYGTRTY